MINYKYIDKWGRYHDKPCLNREPSSNNGWIYTAYAAKVGIQLDNIKLSVCMSKCRIPGNPPHLIRSPDKSLPPMSRDEILGFAALGLLQPEDLQGWNFSPYSIPRFNLIKLAQQLWDLRPSLNRHRNYFWQNGLSQIYRFAFSVPLQDRAFLLECFGETRRLSYLFYKAIAFLDSKIGKPENGIPWLKYGGEERKKIMQAEFPEDHQLRQL